VGVIALHVADDSFLQPQPGTSAGDHLASGLVPLAVLGLAAWAYPRLRGGGRAAVALLLGVFGGVASVEAVHYTTQVGPSGDDFTGLLCIPAAIDFLQQRPDVEPGRIGGLGLSVGGETFVQAAAHSEDVQAVVSEGASTRSVGELLSVPGSDPAPVALMTGITAATAVFSNSSPPTPLVDQVDEIAPRAMFLIHAPSADPDEVRFNRAFYRAAGEPKPSGGSRRPGTWALRTPARASTSSELSASSTEPSERSRDEHPPRRR
jgi:uncharacterized protein